jgi:DNA polymerase-1
MSFIFRAYHAMQRSRPMSTRSGLPTAATYVFVNMIQKLRADFSPHYLAAVFDVSGAVFRDAKAQEIGVLRKWSSKDQAFVETTYEGYKAQREAMPEDLARQLPYIRRALEVLHIPILEAIGFEADDVIGTLARQASRTRPRSLHRLRRQGHDAARHRARPRPQPAKRQPHPRPAKVIEVLGVPPEQVIDVMALRGDTIDNIPGAPGIGDKGSVELIQQFGSVEAVLDAARDNPDAIKRKTYRESLQQNREAVLLSKELVTIDCFVPLDLDLKPDADPGARSRSRPRALHRARIHLHAPRTGPGAQKPTAELIDDPSDAKSPPSSPPRLTHGFAFALEKDAKAAKPPASCQPSPNPAQKSLGRRTAAAMPSLLDIMDAAKS